MIDDDRHDRGIRLLRFEHDRGRQRERIRSARQRDHHAALCKIGNDRTHGPAQLGDGRREGRHVSTLDEASRAA
ncbi:hypothetical protein GCM10010457_01990 [Microbacterium keratanolyticum]